MLRQGFVSFFSKAAIGLVFILPFSSLASAYKLPEGPTGQKMDENTVALEKISHAVASVAKKANKAIVFVSVSKTVQGNPGGMIDPFEFFFGPGARDPSGRGRGQPQQPQPKQQGLGSGFFVDLEKGYILTNNHVVEDADEISLKLANGESFKGKVLGRDKSTDVAVVQVLDKNFNRKGLDAVALGNSDQLEVGDFVIALGAPFGLEASLSFGVISALQRENLGITDLGSFIQTDAAINPGNSGGPLLSTSGEVIGINTAIYSRSGAYNGIGFAIPASIARRVAEQLINDGKVERGFIGVGAQQIDPEMAKEIGLPGESSGALIVNVYENGPAAKAGLEPGDVIVELEGKIIRSQMDLVNTVGLMKPGTKVNMIYYRNGKKQTASVKLERYPDDKAQVKNSVRDEGAGELFGMSLSKVAPFLAQKYGFQSKQGAVVVMVGEGSAADRVGITEGDVILSVNNHKVDGPADVSKLTKGKAKALLRIERQGQFFVVTLRVN